MTLSSVPTLSSQTKSSIQLNITQILQLHQDLLVDLHQIVPWADCSSAAHQDTCPVTKAKHIRFHSADIRHGRLADHHLSRRLRHSHEIGRSPDQRPRTMVADTRIVGNIAKVFNKHVRCTSHQQRCPPTDNHR